jgi:cytochrome c553
MSVHDAADHRAERWRLRTWVAFGAASVLAFLLGFVVMGGALDGRQIGVWAAICRGLGLRPDQAPASEPRAVAVVPSFIAWTPTTLATIASGRSAPGAFVAINCTVCHGARGISTTADVPTLAGMDAAAIYKELADFRSGKRLWGVMNGIALALSPQSLADVSVYYARLPGGLPLLTGRGAIASERSLRSADAARRLVFAGDPSRGIGACASCHGPIGYKLGASALASQDVTYLDRQLAAFAQGSRHNDINEQMRSVAAALTDAERTAVSHYYARQGAREGVDLD